jgi:hypothetical protein
MNYRLHIPTLIVCLGFIAGCAGSRQAVDVDTTSFIVALEEQGLVLQPDGEASQGFLTRMGEAYTLAGGGMLEVFAYESSEAAARDVDRVEPGQMASASQVYRRGNILAIYTGNNPEAEQALHEVMGSRLY